MRDMNRLLGLDRLPKPKHGEWWIVEEQDEEGKVRGRQPMLCLHDRGFSGPVHWFILGDGEAAIDDPSLTPISRVDLYPDRERKPRKPAE